MLQTSKEFFAELATRTGKTQAECKEFWNETLNMIFENCAKSDESSTILPKLGQVIAKVYPMSVARNPATDEKVVVPPTRRIRIKIFPSATDRMNTGFNTAKKSKK